MRLQKYLALSGVASRRNAEKMILEGRISVNHRTVTEMGFLVDENCDLVEADGNPVSIQNEKHYIAYNKPVGEVTTVSDPEGRATVMDKFRDFPVRLYPVGRLDYDTSGLLLLTNDGEFTQKLTHPSFEIWKTYEAVVRGEPNEGNVKRFAEGLTLDDGPTLPALLTVIGHKGNNAIAEVRIREGRNRQVRRMLEAIHHPVLKLRRVGFGPVELDPDLKPGAWRYLKEDEVSKLLGAARVNE